MTSSFLAPESSPLQRNEPAHHHSPQSILVSSLTLDHLREGVFYNKLREGVFGRSAFWSLRVICGSSLLWKNDLAPRRGYCWGCSSLPKVLKLQTINKATLRISFCLCRSSSRRRSHLKAAMVSAEAATKQRKAGSRKHYLPESDHCRVHYQICAFHE